MIGHCSPFAPQRLTKAPLPLFQSVSVLLVVWLTPVTSRYQCVNVVALVI